MRYLQMPYISVLNVFHQLMKHVGEKVRNTGITICCFLLAAYFPLNYSLLLPPFMDDENYRMLFICIIFAIFTILGIRGKIRSVSWRVPITVLYYAFAVTILIARAHHGLATGYTLFALFLLVVFPAYILVWNNRGDYNYLFEKLAFALAWVGIIYAVFSIIVWPYIPECFWEGRYAGLASHPNLFAMIYVCVLGSCIYLIIISRQKILAVLSLGVSFGMIMLTESRTALLAICMILLSTLLFVIRNKKVIDSKIWKFFLLIIISIIIGCGTIWLAALPARILSYEGIKRIQVITENDWKFLSKTSDPKGKGSILFDDLYSQVEIGQFDYENNQDCYQIGQTASASPIKVFNRDVKKDSLNSYSSGRLDIYLWVIKHITIWGTDIDENPIILNNVKYSGAHNTPLEFAYHCGVFAGIICFLFEIIELVIVYIMAFLRKIENKSVLFVVLLSIAFFVESMMEIQTIPSYRDVTCYYLVVLPLAFMVSKKEGELYANQREI